MLYSQQHWATFYHVWSVNDSKRTRSIWDVAFFFPISLNLPFLEDSSVWTKRPQPRNLWRICSPWFVNGSCHEKFAHHIPMIFHYMDGFSWIFQYFFAIFTPQKSHIFPTLWIQTLSKKVLNPPNHSKLYPKHFLRLLGYYPYGYPFMTLDGLSLWIHLFLGRYIFHILPSGKRNITMENQNFHWKNPLFLWPLSSSLCLT